MGCEGGMSLFFGVGDPPSGTRFIYGFSDKEGLKPTDKMA